MPQNSSSSYSSTSQTTNAINPVVVADNGGLAFSNVAGGNITQTVNNTTLDKDVAIRAMDNNLQFGQDVLLANNDAMRQSYGFATNAMEQSFASSNAATQTAFGFAGAANQSANQTSMRAIDSAQSSMDKALAFGSKQTSVALDSLSKSASMIDTAYKDAKGVLGTNVILVAIGAGVLIVYFAMRKK